MKIINAKFVEDTIIHRKLIIKNVCVWMFNKIIWCKWTIPQPENKKLKD
jgi:hypothetical protein